ncbi:hypothetical protein [Sphingopyxis sp. 113P3]|uniref:hypothetical protein n=1 Tax=Sphingopyxis sp. (strain 113P3) TaxID=292913 RepID=UPI0006AD4EA6|nr:hypothetical protein [Sphingopyxis sp. 113P3]
MVKLTCAIALISAPSCLSAQDAASLSIRARSLIAARLVDPDSLVLRNTRAVSTTSPTGENVTVLCGEYNAKNGFGGYGGFRMFFYETASMRGVMTIGSSLDFISQDGSSDYSAEAFRIPGIDPAKLSARFEQLVPYVKSYMPVCQQRS